MKPFLSCALFNLQHVIEEMTKRVLTVKPIRHDRHMATYHQQVTILFADLVGCLGGVRSGNDVGCTMLISWAAAPQAAAPQAAAPHNQTTKVLSFEMTQRSAP